MTSEDARVGQVVSERLDGHGEKGVFYLAFRPVEKILSVIVNGKCVEWDTDFLKVGESAECLVSFYAGRLRFPALRDAPPSQDRFMTVEYELPLDKTIVEALCQHCGRSYAGGETACQSCGALRR